MKVVLAYSGGLDTSVCLKLLQEKYGADVVTLTLELGQDAKDLKKIEAKAKKLGAVKTYSIDVRKEFVADYINPAIKANALYEGKYPLSTAIGRPLIAKWLVKIAKKEKAKAVAHGSTGKGNDQVRFDVTIKALNPKLKILAPIRESPMARNDAIALMKKHGVKLKITKASPYSYDENIWGKSAEAGPLEDPWVEPGETPMYWTTKPEKAPNKPQYMTLEFKKGIPVKLNGRKIPEVQLIRKLNGIGAKHGVGRIDMIEDRVVGIKSRETYECPAAMIVLEAHKALESLTLTREEIFFKETVDSKWTQLAYFGLWHEPLKEDLEAFINKAQEVVSGTVRLKLYKGSCTVVGLKSPHSLYDYKLVTYDREDAFDHAAAEGFIQLWSLPSQIAGRRK